MRLIKSFFYALRGIWQCARRERNFRIHIVAAVSVIAFSVMYGLAAEEYPRIIIVIAMVMSAEAVNTAVENAVDLQNKRNKTAEIAKDAAAGGVLLPAVGSVAVAVFTFNDTDKLKEVFLRFADLPHLICLIAYIIICILFVFKIKEK